MNLWKKLRPFAFLVAGWMVPGLGHYLQKRRGKAAVFFGGILALTGLGLLMRGGYARLASLEPLNVFSFIGGVGTGVFYGAAKFVGLGGGDLWAYTYTYGTAYLAAAGFMNLLVALNALTIAREAGRV